MGRPVQLIADGKGRRPRIPSRPLAYFLVAVLAFSLVAPATTGLGAAPRGEGRGKPGIPVPLEELLSSGGRAALLGQSEDDDGSGEDDALEALVEAAQGAEGNTFVNDPCLDPPPTRNPDPAVQAASRRRTVQSETEIAVLNSRNSRGKLMIAGYNNSFGFYNNRQGLSGVAYSTDGGEHWIDQAGLPPKVPTGAPPSAPGVDGFFGDPVLVVHHATETFYYASIYKKSNGVFTLSVSRARFMMASSQAPVESRSNLRCAGEASKFGQPDTADAMQLRPIWDQPTVIVEEAFLAPDNPATPQDESDFLDKEWIYVDQKTGTLYVTYTRFTAAGETPIELVKCVGCAFKSGPLTNADWSAPSVIVPNEAFDFNQATQPLTTPSGRVIVTWIMRRFAVTGTDAKGAPIVSEVANAIEYAFSDDDGLTWSPEKTVAVVNPQREPPGYNRGRRTILNAPYIVVDKGADDGVTTPAEASRPGFGNIYIAYFSGKTTLPELAPSTTRAADIFVSTSTDDGNSFGAKVKVNDDNTSTVHVFPAIQVNKRGEVFVQWIDRRRDVASNRMNETWADVSRNLGRSFGTDKRISSIATSWYTRDDARPNMGDYNSAELINFTTFIAIWADGRFPGRVDASCHRPQPAIGRTVCPTPADLPTSTPDTVVKIVEDLGD